MLTKKKTKGQVRIIGGTHRSRIVRFIQTPGLRPTADSVRERLFNWLGQNLEQKNILDLFSGSGILAFEAASRGAEHIDAVEKSPIACRILQENYQALNMNNLHTHCCNALSFLEKSSYQYHIIFLDPPYDWQDWSTLWRVLINNMHRNALIYIEQGQAFRLPEYLKVYKQGKSGMSHYQLAEYIQQ